MHISKQQVAQAFDLTDKLLESTPIVWIMALSNVLDGCDAETKHMICAKLFGLLAWQLAGADDEKADKLMVDFAEALGSTGAIITATGRKIS